MKRQILVFGVALALITTGVSVESKAVASHKPNVGLIVTYDPTVGNARAEAVFDLIHGLASNRVDWALRGNSVGATPTESAQSTGRRSLVEWARGENVDYGVYIRVTKQQSIYSHPWISAEALTVSAESGLFVIITEAAWAPDDTLAQRRQLEMLFDRLIPLKADSICYYEFVDVETIRNEVGAVLEAGLGLRVYGKSQIPVEGAQIRGHWLINAETKTTESLTTDESGETRIHFSADGIEESVGNAEFIVDTVLCPNAVFDPQWPQREMAEALAVLENARADLDEDANYADAIERARHFLSYDESNIAWYAPLMNPINAPNRRQQAEMILRRARTDQTGVESRTGIPTIYRPNWMYRLWGGIGLRENEEEFIAKSPDGLETQKIGVDNGVPFGVGVDVRRRIVNNFWLGGGGSWEASRLTLNVRPVSHKSQLRLWVLSAAMRYMRGEANRIAFYAEGGVRSTYRTVTGPTFVADGRLYSSAAEAGANGSTVLQFDAESGTMYPGITVAAGFGIPMADFDTVWTNIDVSLNVDRLPSGRANSFGMLRLGTTLRR